MSSPPSIAFLGATGGCGLSALRLALTSAHTCTALVRNPEKLTSLLPSPPPANLFIKSGNAHSVPSVSSCLVNPTSPTTFVDKILFSIGGAFNLSKMTLDDPEVCSKGISTLLSAISQLREQGIKGTPEIIVISTNGISDHGRDYPLLMTPFYKFMLKVPHVDKRAMEATILASDEAWTVVRPSMLTDGGGSEERKEVRVGVESPGKGVERKVVGYSISREDVGRWVFENCLQGKGEYVGNIVSITW